MNPLSKLHRIVQRLRGDLKRKRTTAGLLNYGVIAFGPHKEDYLFRLTPKALAENSVFTVRYIAVVDVFVILGLLLWALGFTYGFLIFLFAFVLACVVFIDHREIEKRKRMVASTIGKPVKKTIEAVKRTPRFLKKVIKRKK